MDMYKYFTEGPIYSNFVYTNKGKLHTQEYWIESHQIEFDALTFDWLNNEFCQIGLKSDNLQLSLGQWDEQLIDQAFDVSSIIFFQYFL